MTFRVRRRKRRIVGRNISEKGKVLTKHDSKIEKTNENSTDLKGDNVKLNLTFNKLDQEPERIFGNNEFVGIRNSREKSPDGGRISKQRRLDCNLEAASPDLDTKAEDKEEEEIDIEDGCNEVVFINEEMFIKRGMHSLTFPDINEGSDVRSTKKTLLQAHLIKVQDKKKLSVMTKLSNELSLIKKCNLDSV